MNVPRLPRLSAVDQLLPWSGRLCDMLEGTVQDLINSVAPLSDLSLTGTLSVDGLVAAKAGLHVGGTSDPGTDNLKVDGTITAGSGSVGITGADGRIPALSTTYLADLSGANLTGLLKTGDVYAWAKAAAKPTYSYSEVGADASGAAAAITLSGLGGSGKSLVLGSPTGGDKGAGSLNATYLYQNGSPIVSFPGGGVTNNVDVGGPGGSGTVTLHFSSGIFTGT